MKKVLLWYPLKGGGLQYAPNAFEETRHCRKTRRKKVTHLLKVYKKQKRCSNEKVKLKGGGVGWGGGGISNQTFFNTSFLLMS